MGSMHQPVYPVLDEGVHPLPTGTLVQLHRPTYDEDVDTNPDEALPRGAYWNAAGGLERWAFESDVGTVVSVDYNDFRSWFPTYGVVFPNGCWVYFDHDDSPQHYDFHVFQEAAR